MERFTEYRAGVPVILDKGEGRRVAAAKRFAELEERATPKKVKMTVSKVFAVGMIGHCPNCGRTLRGNMKHCDYCGQKLKWEVEEK